MNKFYYFPAACQQPWPTQPRLSCFGDFDILHPELSDRGEGGTFPEAAMSATDFYWSTPGRAATKYNTQYQHVPIDHFFFLFFFLVFFRLFRTNTSIFRTDTVIFRTNTVIFRTKPVISRTNTVKFMTNPGIFRTNYIIIRTNPVIFRIILVIFSQNSIIRSYFSGRAKKSLGWRPQELEIGPHSGSYLLVMINRKIWLSYFHYLNLLYLTKFNPVPIVRV